MPCKDRRGLVRAQQSKSRPPKGAKKKKKKQKIKNKGGGVICAPRAKHGIVPNNQFRKVPTYILNLLTFEIYENSNMPKLCKELSVTDRLIT